jgi:hypothetical protein
MLRMIPMRTSSIFRSRWMALLWAAGFIWLALDVAGGASSPSNSAASQADTGLTDASGQPITSEDSEKVANALGL